MYMCPSFVMLLRFESYAHTKPLDEIDNDVLLYVCGCVNKRLEAPIYVFDGGTKNDRLFIRCAC